MLFFPPLNSYNKQFDALRLRAGWHQGQRRNWISEQAGCALACRWQPARTKGGRDQMTAGANPGDHVPGVCNSCSRPGVFGSHAVAKVCLGLHFSVSSAWCLGWSAHASFHENFTWYAVCSMHLLCSWWLSWQLVLVALLLVVLAWFVVVAAAVFVVLILFCYLFVCFLLLVVLFIFFLFMGVLVMIFMYIQRTIVKLLISYGKA